MIATEKHIFIGVFPNGKSLAFLNGRSLSCTFRIQGPSELVYVFHTGMFGKDCRCWAEAEFEEFSIQILCY